MEAHFINRVNELESLASLFDSPKFEFIIIYGRRRVGKTELIKKAIKDRTYIYY